MDALEELEAVLDRLAGADPFSYGDAASVLALEGALTRLSCVTSKAVASFDAGGEWAHEGAQSTAAWLSTRCHLPLGDARSQLRRGRALPSVPLCAEAFCAGAIGVAQVDLLVKAAQGTARVNQEAFPRDEAVLLAAARELKFAPFSGVVAYWTQLADPDGAEESAMEKMARRDVYVSHSVGGMWLGKMTFDPIGGAIYAGELMRLEAEMFDADWAEAKARLGRDPHLDDVARTPAQRRADAAVEMAVRSKAMPEGARRPEPLFSVLVDYPTLAGRICQLANGGIVSPGSLVPWIEAASFERIVFAPPKRIECSVTARFFTGATRRAIEIRDQHCTHPYCEAPAERCQIDHIIPYSQGGETTQENGRVHCGFHNRRRNGGPDPGD
jgi:hypothetical protein